MTARSFQRKSSPLERVCPAHFVRVAEYCLVAVSPVFSTGHATPDAGREMSIGRTGGTLRAGGLPPVVMFFDKNPPPVGPGTARKRAVPGPTETVSLAQARAACLGREHPRQLVRGSRSRNLCRRSATSSACRIRDVCVDHTAFTAFLLRQSLAVRRGIGETDRQLTRPCGVRRDNPGIVDLHVSLSIG